MPDAIAKYAYYFTSIGQLLTGLENPLQTVGIFLNITQPGVKQVRLRKQGLTFSVRTAMDVWSVKEAFIDRFYETYGTPVGDGWTVIDIGGGLGEFTLFAAVGHPNNRVLAFEPFGQSYQLLVENVRKSGVVNVDAINEAVSSRTGSLVLASSAGEPLQFQSGRNLEEAKGETVPAISLEDLFARHSIETCDLLKLDCEGAEYDILFNAPDTILQRIYRMVMEYHDGVTAHTHDELRAFLNDKGFQTRVTPNVVHDDLGYLYAYRPQSGEPKPDDVKGMKHT